MADKTDNKNKALLDSDDYEYEKQIYDKQKQQEQELEAKRAALREERKRREKEEKREHERQLAKERIELMKHKGEAQNSDGGEDTKASEEQPEVSGEDTSSNKKKSVVKKADNFFYHNKWWLGMLAIILCVAGFILYNELTRKRPDLVVYMICDNDLQQRQQPLEEFFEEYVDDIDGNGYVHVEVQIIPLDRSLHDQTQMDNNTMFLTQLYSTKNMLVITDSNTDDYYMEIMDSTLKSKFPGNKYVDERGFSLNMKQVADKLEFENMPNDIHISIRQPVATVDDSLETAKKNYDINFKYLEKMINDLTQKAEESNDPGLTTEPKKKDNSSSVAE